MPKHFQVGLVENLPPIEDHVTRQVAMGPGRYHGWLKRLWMMIFG